MGLPNDVYFQIGMLTTLGLTTKNAILIVQFAKNRVEEGMDLIAATLEAAKLRLAPDRHDLAGIRIRRASLGHRRRGRCRRSKRHRHRRPGRRGHFDVPRHPVCAALLRADLQDVGRLPPTRADLNRCRLSLHESTPFRGATRDYASLTMCSQHANQSARHGGRHVWTQPSIANTRKQAAWCHDSPARLTLTTSRAASRRRRAIAKWCTS